MGRSTQARQSKTSGEKQQLASQALQSKGTGEKQPLASQSLQSKGTGSPSVVNKRKEPMDRSPAALAQAQSNKQQKVANPDDMASVEEFYVEPAAASNPKDNESSSAESETVVHESSSSGTSQPDAGKEGTDLPASSPMLRGRKGKKAAQESDSSSSDSSSSEDIEDMPTPVKKPASINQLQRGRKIKPYSSPAGRNFPTRTCYDVLFDLLFELVSHMHYPLKHCKHLHFHLLPFW